MRYEGSNGLDRRKFLETSAALGLVALGCGESETGAAPSTGENGGAPAEVPAPSNAGNGGAEPDAACQGTGDDILGPYFKPESPERSLLVAPEDPGVRLKLSGRVLDADCQALSNAVVDFWQANDAGEYDSVGFAFRGHVRVAEDGSYTLQTIIPGRYLNGDTYRPAHIHVKVYVGLEERLVTQLYFEGDPYNEADPWYEAPRALALKDGADGKQASFDFVV